MKQSGNNRFVMAAVGVTIAAIVAAAVGMGSFSNTGEKVDRNVPGATTGPGKSSLAE